MESQVRLAVTGMPVAHSKSPQIFRRFYEMCGISGFYTRIAADSVSEAVATAETAGIRGINVTSPFKEQAATIATVRDEASGLLGASNTLLLGARAREGLTGLPCSSGRGKDAGIKAYNTDYLGVKQSAAGFFPEGGRGRAFVLGSGGAGTAAAFGLSMAGFDVTVFNRNTEKASAVCGKISGCSVLPLGMIGEKAPGADLIVNALPLGKALFDPLSLGGKTVVLDADYRNSPYDPVRTGGSYRYIPGLSWLLHQAESAFGIFTGSEADDGLASLVKESDLAAVRKSNISLIGFMGSGKTTTGRHLAHLLGWDFTDIDLEIEKAERMSISSIFSMKGEHYFRQAEKIMTEKVFGRVKNHVISCGGGAVIDGGNRKVILSGSYPVWLAPPPDTAAARAGGKGRPLLEGKGMNAACRIYSERIDFYGGTAELVIDSSARGAAETAERIYEEISFIFGC